LSIITLKHYLKYIFTQIILLLSIMEHRKRITLLIGLDRNRSLFCNWHALKFKNKFRIKATISFWPSLGRLAILCTKASSSMHLYKMKNFYTFRLQIKIVPLSSANLNLNSKWFSSVDSMSLLFQ
jgi:hypothetical protein